MVNSSNSYPHFYEPVSYGGNQGPINNQIASAPPLFDEPGAPYQAPFATYPQSDNYPSFQNTPPPPPPYNPNYPVASGNYAQPIFPSGFPQIAPLPLYPTSCPQDFYNRPQDVNSRFPLTPSQPIQGPSYPSVPSVASYYIPSSSIKRVGFYNGNEIIEVNSSGKRYVVYEKNELNRRLIAMPYKGLHTLRNTQTIASSILGLLSAGLVAKTALIFKATVLTTSLVSGIAGILIFGIGMIYTWYHNDQDPAAQMEIRTKQLREQTIDLNHFTTPKEKRSFLFNKAYADIKEFADDLNSLMVLDLLTPNEIRFYQNNTITIVQLIKSLEHEYESKIAPHKSSMIDQTNQAQSDYYHSSAYQTDCLIEEAHRHAKFAKASNGQCEYKSDDAAIDLAYFGAKQLNASSIRIERAVCQQKISQAKSQFAATEVQIKSDINYEERLTEIRILFEAHFRQFKEFFSNQDLVAFDTNVSDLGDSAYLLNC